MFTQAKLKVDKNNEGKFDELKSTHVPLLRLSWRQKFWHESNPLCVWFCENEQHASAQLKWKDIFSRDRANFL